LPQRAQRKVLLCFLILRIFASFAAEKYFFSVPQRLCGKHFKNLCVLCVLCAFAVNYYFY